MNWYRNSLSKEIIVSLVIKIIFLIVISYLFFSDSEEKSKVSVSNHIFNTCYETIHNKPNN